MEVVVPRSLFDELKRNYEPVLRIAPLEQTLKTLQLANVRVRYMPPPEQWSPYVDVVLGQAEDFDGR